MKGWIKGMLIVSAICVITGAVLGGAAWAMGGRLSYFYERKQVHGTRDNTVEVPVSEKKEPETRRTESENGLRAGTGENQTPETAAETLYQQESGTAEAVSGSGKAEYEGRLISELEINVEGAKVELTADPSSDKIQVFCDDENYRCIQETDEDTLKLHIRMRKNIDQSLFETWEETAAQIIIPADVLFDEVELEIAGGVLTADWINANKLSLEVQGGKLEVLSGSVGDLSGECQAGELIYEGQAWWKVDGECQAGAIRYFIEGREEDFNYEIDTAVGRIAIGGTEIKDLIKETVINNPGATKRAELDCEAGAIDMDFYQP